MKFVIGALFVALAAGLCFSGMAVIDLRKQVSDLDAKIAALNEHPAAPAPAADIAKPAPHPDAAPSQPDSKSPPVAADPASGTIFDPGSSAPVALKAGGSDAPSGGPSVNPAAWTDADREAFQKEVLAVMDKQQKEREAKQGEKQTEWMMARLKDKLKLTDAQAEQIGKLLATTTEQVKELRATMTPENREEVRPKIQATVQAADTQIKGLLTAEQSASYDELKKTGGGLGFGGGGQGGGGGKRRQQGQNGGGEPQ